MPPFFSIYFSIWIQIFFSVKTKYFHSKKKSSRAAVYVRLGELDSSTEEDDAHPQIYNVTERIIHPLYLVDYLHNDIALLRVGGRIEFNEYIQPACMPSAESIVSKNIVALGWGTVSPDNRIYSHLQKVQLNLVPLAKCHELYGQPEQEKLHQEIAVETQICANSSVPERDTCAVSENEIDKCLNNRKKKWEFEAQWTSQFQGFGGGPLLNTHHKFSCLYETIGITSLGSKCGSGYPGAYTRIAAYVDWIESVVWATWNDIEKTNSKYHSAN